MQFHCQHCGHERDVPAKLAGKTVRCPKCKGRVRVGEAPADEKNRYSLEEFVRRTSQADRGQGLFELESERLLEINLDGRVWTKMGSMVAYRGEIRFTREGVLEHGVGRMLKKAVSGEGGRLTKAEGRGALYLADKGKKVSIVHLHGESVVVNGNDLLAFEDGIRWNISLMKRAAGMLAGGLFNVRLEGDGMVALTTHHDPMTLRVRPEHPVHTDPNATVAWSGDLAPDLRADVTVRTFLGRGSGESFQMRFQGSGFVVVQPYEEVSFQSGKRGR